jgi:hypothetical protein
VPASLLVTTALYTSPATSTFTSVPDLSVAVTAGISYAFEFNLLVFASATTNGHTLSVLGPASPTYLRYAWQVNTSATGVSQGGSDVYDHAVAVPATSGSATATAPMLSQINGLIVPSVDGILEVRIKPEVSASVNVARGSWGTVAS